MVQTAREDTSIQNKGVQASWQLPIRGQLRGVLLMLRNKEYYDSEIERIRSEKEFLITYLGKYLRDKDGNSEK